jgi:hypothetical protein
MRLTIAGMPELPEECTFARRGDEWTIAYGGIVSRLRDRRGLRYLATLLRHPGQTFHCTDLVAMASEATDAGDHVSLAAVPTAKAYRARLTELQDDLDEAGRWNDVGRIEHARTEAEILLEAALRVACDPSWRSAAERARLAVTKGIGSALKRICTVNRDLAAHVSVTVKRGYYCAYRPDPRRFIVWRG